MFQKGSFKKKVLKYGTPKPSLGFRVQGFGFIYVVLGAGGVINHKSLDLKKASRFPVVYNGYVLICRSCIWGFRV